MCATVNNLNFSLMDIEGAVKEEKNEAKRRMLQWKSATMSQKQYYKY